MMEYNTFRLNRKGQKIEFECSKSWILDKVEDYIALIMDATNYRNTIHRLVQTGDEPLHEPRKSEGSKSDEVSGTWC